MSGGPLLSEVSAGLRSPLGSLPMGPLLNYILGVAASTLTLVFMLAYALQLSSKLVLKGFFHDLLLFRLATSKLVLFWTD